MSRHQSVTWYLQSSHHTTLNFYFRPHLIMFTPTALQQERHALREEWPAIPRPWLLHLYSLGGPVHPGSRRLNHSPIQSSKTSHHKNLNSKSFPKTPRLLGVPDFATILKRTIHLPKTRQSHALIIGIFRSFLVTQSIRLGLEPEGFTKGISPLNTLGSWKRQPESCWRPAGRGAPITVVLEVGMAQHESGLHRSVYE